MGIGKFLQEAARTVREDTTGFWAAVMFSIVVFMLIIWLAEEIPFWTDTSPHGLILRGCRWTRRNWVYILVALWYWPRLSVILAFADNHGAAMFIGFWCVIAIFMPTILFARGFEVAYGIVWQVECLIHLIDRMLRGILAIIRATLSAFRHFPLQFAALILLIVMAGSVQQPAQVWAEVEPEQIITVEEVANNDLPAAETADKPYEPATSVNGTRYVTELVTQSPITSGRVNDAFVIVETKGGDPISVRWITEGRTALIDVLSDEPVTIGFSAIGMAPKHTQTVKGDDEVYTHGKLFKIELPENWEDPSAVIIVENDSGSVISIDWRPN